MSIAASGGSYLRHHDLREHALLEEEEGEIGGALGSWGKEPLDAAEEALLSTLTPADRAVIRGLDNRARKYSKRAGRARRTHVLLALTSIVAAAFVPVAVAVGAPSWVAAVLGAVAAVAQSVLQLTRSDQHATEVHAMLVRLTALRDYLRLDLREAKTDDTRSAAVAAYERAAVGLISEASDRVARLGADGDQRR